MNIDIVPFFDQPTATWSYLIADPGTRQAAIVDPVLDFDAAAGRTGRASADRLLQAVQERSLDVAWILETHAHADHLTAALDRMLKDADPRVRCRRLRDDHPKVGAA